jgi:hypothetical protein
MILGFAFICTLFLCIVKPKCGLYGLFIFALLLSNALQLTFVETNRSFSTPFSIIKLANVDIIDKQGTRLLVLILFLSSILRKVFAKKRINEMWLIKIILMILLISVSSMLLNNITVRDGFSSISLLIISLVFLSAVSNLQFNCRDIQSFLYCLLVFVLINAIFQIYQFFNYAFGDVDMTLGLLTSTTPTSTLAFVVVFFFIGKISVGRFDQTVFLSIILSLVQLVSSFLKGILSFALIILISFWRLLFKGGKVSIGAVFALILMFSVASFIFQDTVKDYNVFFEFDNLSSYLDIGPVRVWTQYIQVVDNPANVIFGYGPSSYGSINTTGEDDVRRSKLAELISITDATGSLAGRDIFRTALSSAGNILWENGVIVLVLFFLVYFRVFKISSRILKNSNSEIIKVYAFGVKYEIMFIVLLYFLAFGTTTEEILLWGPAFVVFSFNKSQFQFESSK